MESMPAVSSWRHGLDGHFQLLIKVISCAAAAPYITIRSRTPHEDTPVDLDRRSLLVRPLTQVSRPAACVIVSTIRLCRRSQRRANMN